MAIGGSGIFHRLREAETIAAGTPKLKSLYDEKVTGVTVLLRWRDGSAQIFGAEHLTIGEPGVSDCWVQWHWDGARFRIETDRFGLRPVFWAQVGDDFAVALDLRDLLSLGVPATLDDNAVATFLCIGSYLSEATPFRAIRALPAGATLVWERGVVEITSRLKWPKPDRTISRAAAVDQYVDMFHAAVARRAARATDPMLPLSGGLDSTHILLAMNHGGALPATCVTVDDWFADNMRDVVLARESARRFGVPHEVLAEPVSLVAAQRWIQEEIGLRGHAHFWAMPLAAHLARRRPRHFFDGLGGDNLSASSFISRDWIEPLQQGRMLDVAETIIARSGGESYRADLIAAPIWRRFSKQTAREVIAAELARHLECANPIGRFMFVNRLRTLIAPLSTVAFGRYAEPVFPFLDEALFEFLAALPVSFMFNKSFHRDAMARAYGDGWSPPIAAQRPSRMLMRRLAQWREIARDGYRYYTMFRPVLRRPAHVLNPLRWAAARYPHSGFLLALYLAQIQAVENGAHDPAAAPVLRYGAVPS